MKILTKKEYECLRNKAEILESGIYGEKVLKLGNGTFLKLFRVKKMISSKRLFPETWLFTRNAKNLTKLGIPTVVVLEKVRVPHLKKTGIIYSPLEGRNFRQVVVLEDMDANLVYKLGAFFAKLHSKGIYFRSCHLGNVLLCPDKSIGLIDIADTRFFPWKISANACIRNFRHLFRYPDDFKILADVGFENFVKGYTAKYPKLETKLKNEIAKWYSKPNYSVTKL